MVHLSQRQLVDFPLIRCLIELDKDATSAVGCEECCFMRTSSKAQIRVFFHTASTKSTLTVTFP